MQVLVVEDDDAIAEPLVEGLTREGYTVARVATGRDALGADETDLVILDLGLPDMDGYSVCQQLRARSAVPILVVTARGAEADKVLGLELGADDYLVKPFGFRELVARIKAVMRRIPDAVAEPVNGVQDLGPLLLDRRTRKVFVAGTEIVLSPKEYDLLALLAEDPGAVVSRQTILEEVWDPHWYGPTKTVDVHVASLRRKLGNSEWIETVRKVGLRLAGELAPGDPAGAGG